MDRGTDGRRPVPVRRLAPAVAVLGGLLATVMGAAAPAHAATVRSATVVVAPERAGLLQGGALHVEVAITNDGADALAAGTVRLALEQATVADGETLVKALSNPAPNDYLQGYDVGTAQVGELAPSATIRIRITVPAGVVSAYTQLEGAHLLAAQIRVDGDAVATGAAAVTRAPSEKSAGVRLAAVVPMVLPATAAPSGLADADEVATMTAPDGDWSTALDAAQADPAATLALDPAVLASIRVLGTAAPSTATALLQALAALPNPTVELPYADGDVTLERAAGATRVLTPTGFSATIAGGTASATPSPTPAATGSISSVADLTRWNWSTTHLAWPVPGTTGTADLGFLARSGFADTLLSSDDVADTAARRTDGPLAMIGSSRVLVADSATSRLLDEAAGERSPASAAAASQLVGLLATDATDGGTPTVLAVPARSADGGGRLGDVLRLLRAQPWIADADLGDLTAQKDPAHVALTQHAPAAASVARARQLIAADTAVQRVGSAITTGATAVTSPYRLTALAMLSAAWREAGASWAAASTTATRTLATFAFRSVQLLPVGSGYDLGVDGSLPVPVRNTLAVPVRIRLTGVPDNDRMILNAAETRTIGADQTALVPLATRSISNGQVQIRLTLTTPGGLQLSPPRSADITVNAGWDTLGAVIFVGALLALFGVGVYRNLTRRRRRSKALAA